MAAALEGKEKETEQLLDEGSTPVELIQSGFKRGTVYKVSRRLDQVSRAGAAAHSGGMLQNAAMPASSKATTPPDLC